MASVAFDALALTKRLRGQFTPEQAESLAEAFGNGIGDQLATKSDLVATTSDLGREIKELELRIDTRLAQVDAKIAETARSTTIWLIATILPSLALAVAVIKLVP